MARIVAIGGGMVGLTTAMLLAKDGHDVTVLERDPAEPPDSAEAAWAGWERRGVNQFRMLHYFLPRFRATIEAEIPEVVDALDEFGALRIDPLASAPPEITGGPRAGDEDFATITARRPVVEGAVSLAAVRTPGVTIRRGVGIDGLLTGLTASDEVPQVRGVCTTAGEDEIADLVVDATGRRSTLPDRLAAIGARPAVEELEDCGFVYFARHFRSADGSVPPNLGPLLQHYGTVSVLTLPADHGTWSVGVIASAHDAPMRALRDPARWEAVLQSCPLVAHWLDGEPLDEGVAVMAKIEDRHREFCIDGRPVATGVVAVGDSWACTNPSVGRGCSIGLLHGVALRDLARDASLRDPRSFAVAWHEATMRTVEPWYRATLQYDRNRLGEIDAGAAGRPYEPEDPTYGVVKALEFGAMQDPDVLRAYLRAASMIELPEDAIAASGVFEKLIDIGDSWRDAEVPAPDRAGLLRLLEV